MINYDLSIDSIDTLTADYVARVQSSMTAPVPTYYEPDGDPTNALTPHVLPIPCVLGTQVADDPAMLGYGADLSCGFTGNGAEIDITDDASEIDPFSYAAVEQSLIRMFSTPNGRLLSNDADMMAVNEDFNYGYNLIQLLGVGLDPITIRAYCDQASAAALTDDRIQSCKIILDTTQDSTLTILVSAVLITGQAYDFVFPLTSDNLPQLTG